MNAGFTGEGDKACISADVSRVSQLISRCTAQCFRSVRKSTKTSPGSAPESCLAEMGGE